MSSVLVQATGSRHVQLAATAVLSGAVVAAALLGYQHHSQEVRLRQLKRAVRQQVEAEAEAGAVAGAVAGANEDAAVGAGAGASAGAEGPPADAEEVRALALAKRAQAGDYAEEVVLEQLTRNQAFLTPAGLARVREAVVVVVGCGGVGSHCAAALARSGVGRLRLVDFDQVSLSSLNRHAVATLADVGRPKVRVLARRLLAVSPWVRFDLRQAKFDGGSAKQLLGGWTDEAAAASWSLGSEAVSSASSSYSSSSSSSSSSVPPTFIVDAIDNIDSKVELLRYCHEHKMPVIASMGAGTKSDPTKVVVGDLAGSAEDRLSRATRRRLKLLGITSGITAVYSTEPAGDGKAALLPLPDDQYARLGKDAVRELGALPDFRVRILPVLGTMPAVFGYTLANHILLTVSGYPYEYSAVKGRDKMYEQILGAVHGAEERLIRHREEMEKGETQAADEKEEEEEEEEKGSAEPEQAAKKGKKQSKKSNSKKKQKQQHDPNSLAVGIRVPLTPGDVAFLIEDIYHGRSAVSDLPTRTTLVRWQLPLGDDGTAASLVQRVSGVVVVTEEDGDGHPATESEQRSTRLPLADLVCMTREEAARHQDEVLLGGRPAAELYDTDTLARIEKRRREAAAYEEYRM